MTPWNHIEQVIITLAKTGGGFSMAHRGIVTLPDGRRIFVKVGVNEETKRWAKKEVETYRFLKRHNYPYIPTLIAYNDDETSFALEPLLPEDGWDWSDTWTKERLGKTIEAMDALAAIAPTDADKAFFSAKAASEADDGWRPLWQSEELQQTLLGKLETAGHSDITARLDFAQEAERSAHFIFNTNELVHNDIRADNCAWSPRQQSVKLVDWNWIQLGDRRIDMAATLVSVHKAGLDVTQDYAERLDADALHWLAGFWFKSAATPIWPGGPEHLRDVQLRSGMVAFELAAKCLVERVEK